MILKQMMEDLESKSGPIAKQLYKNQMTKVLAIAFKKNMILKEHKAPGLTRLFVMAGKIEYRSNPQTLILNEYDEMEIPLDEVHSVYAIEDSLITLIVELR